MNDEYEPQDDQIEFAEIDEPDVETDVENEEPAPQVESELPPAPPVRGPEASAEPDPIPDEEPEQPADAETTREKEAQAIRGLATAYKRMQEEIRKVIIGQTDVIDELLIAMFSRGHCLLVGVPGLAKTLLVSTISRILQLSFRRIQFTPDLMPSDITGTDVLQDDPETGRRTFQFMQGPLFTHMLLADEINRTPPKTQAALLEAMQERHVTVGSSTYRLPEPFFVLATQNPIEQEGTYPLPEAQLDRFMFNVVVQYPNAAEELRILKQTTGGLEPELKTALTGGQILALQEVVRKVPVAEHVFVFARDLVRATRPNEPGAPKFVREYLSWGAGPRAGQFLILGAKARAILQGRFHVSTDDIKAVARPVLRHRIVTTFHADSENMTPDDIIAMLLDHVPVALHEKARNVVR
jgi:MoxR-like ATPase